MVRLKIDKKKTPKDVHEFINHCVKTALTLTTTPFVYGGISFRHFDSGNSERYFARRVIQIFRNSNPEVFGSKELLITEGTKLYVLVKYQDEWCFCRVPDALREPVKNFGKTHNIYCGFAVYGHAANNIEFLADHS